MQPHPAVLDRSLEIRVAHHFFDHFVEVENLSRERDIGAVQPRQLQHLADERIEAFDLALQPVQLARDVGGRLACEPEGDAHSGQRRTQLMGDVAQQPRDGAAVGPQLIRHGIEVPRQYREFVAAPLQAGAHARPRIAPHIEILRGERAHSFLDSPDGCAEMLRQPPAGEGADDERHAEDGERDAGQAQCAEDAGPPRHQQHGVVRAVGAGDLRRGASPRPGLVAIEKFQAPLGALGKPASQDVGSVAADDVKLPARKSVLVRRQPLLQGADAAVRQHLGRSNGRGRTALQFRRLIFPRCHGEGDGDAAADDERHRDPEQSEDPQEKTMHAPRSACSPNRARS